MPDILHEAQIRLKQDFISPSLEWEYLESLISKSEPDRLLLLKWVFEKSPAYWETRARAGQILLQIDEEQTWRIIQSLVDSPDPDDNGTALTLFEATGDPRGLELAKSWLSGSTHPTTQLEAVNFLKEVYPSEVRVCMQALIVHPNPDIQRSARKIADELQITKI